nr:glutathione S-transferase C-terminal domain-containing protein [Burkholderiaceae bacterium]
ALVWRDHPAVRADVARIEQMWTALLQAHGGPMLFGRFTIADAFFAPVCTRIRTYGLPVSAPVAAYVDAVLALPGVRAWIDDALAEHDFVVFDEPYRIKP